VARGDRPVTVDSGMAVIAIESILDHEVVVVG
jgi:hypothetical protein